MSTTMNSVDAYRRARWRMMSRISACPKPADLLISGIELSEAEAQLLAARGLIHHIVHGIWSVEPPGQEERVRAAQLFMRPDSRRHTVLHGLSAAWVYAACSAPDPLICSFIKRSRHKLIPEEEAFLTRASRRYTEEDCRVIEGLRVTTPLRTCVDLAQEDDPISRSALQTLMLAPSLGCSPGMVSATLNAHPYVRRRAESVARVRELGAVVLRAA